jgi:putative acetyltransferase
MHRKALSRFVKPMPQADPILIAPALSAAHLLQAAALMRAYQHELGVDLCFQSFDEELAGLPGDYAPPRGGLFLAWCNGAAVGCGAFREAEHDPALSEMKRVYLQPAARGTGAGRALVERLVSSARSVGYRGMVLDTLPQLKVSHALYESLGFFDIPAYNDNPVPGVRFLRLNF